MSLVGAWIKELGGPFRIYGKPHLKVLSGDAKLFDLSLSENLRGADISSRVEGDLHQLTLTGWKKIGTAQKISNDKYEMNAVPWMGTFRFKSEGGTGVVFRLAEPQPWRVESFLLVEKFWRDLGLSVFFFLFVGIISITLLFKKFDNTAESTDVLTDELAITDPIPVLETPQISEETIGLLGNLSEQAFRGRKSYSDVATVTDKISGDLTKIQNLAQGLSKIRNQLQNKGVNIKSSGADLSGVSAAALAKAGKEIDGALKGQRSKGTSATQVGLKLDSAAKVFSAQDELRVRKIFDSLSPKFVAAFDRALLLDSSLSVTMSWEAIVQKNGRLNQIKIRSSGSGNDKAIQKLEEQVKAILAAIQLGINAEGVVIKGERLFAQ